MIFALDTWVSLLALVGPHHDHAEYVTEEHDEEEIDQRERGRGSEIELAHGQAGQELAEERGAVARAAAGEHERLRVDHEAVHEPEQHRDGEHARELRELDIAEYRPRR